ncbi:gp206 [Bacillus phage G]|uniref:Gp206 n=1 Tax=Bacillus phage G TaxID=2884420 RepID=G3MBS2_9CAUD|nr:gp206 [Bacillus phage G]AEO93465.1 gp206 [Bacillus phage G]
MGKYRKNVLRPTRKKIPNLLDRVREHIVHLRDYGDEIAKKERRYFRGFVTKESLAKQFGVLEGEIQHCLQKLNLEGLVSQAIKMRGDDRWTPDFYYINNCVYVKEEEKAHPLFNLDICPICETELEAKSHRPHITPFNKHCPNKCFSHTMEDDGNIVTIFGKDIYFKEMLSKGLKHQARNTMDKEIAYWRKDYRYVLKLLEGK